MKTQSNTSQPKQNDFILEAGKIFLFWLFMIITNFSLQFIENEFDVLPYARQTAIHNWLPKDWYLNLSIDYRYLFNLLLGNFISWVGFENGAYIGRLLEYLLFAIALYFFFKALKLNFSLGFFVLTLFMFQHSVVAGEWMIGGVETKTIAYAFILLSFSLFFRKQYLLGFAFAGAALTFHVLVGIYALFCLGIAILLNKEWWSGWRQYAVNSWPFFITSFFGLKAIIEQLLPKGNINSAKAWDIYVKYRVPHHVLPSTWDGNLWKLILILAIWLFLFMYFAGKSKSIRFVAAYSLGSTLLFLTGLTIYELGKISLLRFYWFRFPDVIIMFMSYVLIALFIASFEEGNFTLPILSSQIQVRLQTVAKQIVPKFIVLITIFSILVYLFRIQKEVKDFHTSNTDPRLSALQWISKNTPQQAVFLIDPTMEDFYVYAQRAIFVSWKHSPQSAPDILEWYKRIILCNNNLAPTQNGFEDTTELQTNFYKLDEAHIRNIVQQYGINYYLGRSSQNLAFEHVYDNSQYTLYKIENP
ncbi:MAG: DUF6798 domain-containing protein [Anaerolineales bacterium]